MQAFLPRSYLTPVRDEEAESQRKAKSRHARQTRRSTQGVTLTDLKEAQKSNILSPQNSRKAEGGPLAELSCLKNGLTDDRRVRSVSMETTETAEISPKWPDGPKWSKMDEQGNVERRLETIADSPMSDLPCSCVAGSRGLLHCNNAFTAGAICRRDENQNRVEDEAPLTFETRQRLFCDGEHDRLSRYDSSGESATDKPLGRAGSYTRRETRLAALSKEEQDSSSKDYKKMYAEALHENEKLKSRLQDSKHELVKIRSQLDKVTQRHDRLSERSTVLESEKREKQALDKKVSNMEDELKAFPALAQVQTLRRVNECLLAENRAMLRALARLSETASMPETEDL
uniref:protein phosphatase 1 regulatory subunit 12B-like isoform X2 n=1 Tax=Gasterosteus aculeatus aculeatus TaxID=481459 RepID=UPI001A99B2A7|nr:protein phosphatase 1 regulatory subunit 12B-like isoform X2 [Gasterosteus aculeatus aculeatus]